MGDDAKRDKPATCDDGARGPCGPDAGWEARALARIRPHVAQLSKATKPPPDGWETDTLTRLEDYFRRVED